MKKTLWQSSLTACVLSFTAAGLMASSHSDAPLIKQDPQANLTDVYAFVGNGAGGQVLNIVVNCRPFSEPGDGVIYERFADDALYSLKIADPNTGAVLQTYNFRFSAVSSAAGNYKNLNTNQIPPPLSAPCQYIDYQDSQGDAVPYGQVMLAGITMNPAALFPTAMPELSNSRWLKLWALRLFARKWLWQAGNCSSAALPSVAAS